MNEVIEYKNLQNNVIDISLYLNKSNSSLPAHIRRLEGKLPSDDVVVNQETGSDCITDRETINTMISYAYNNKKYRNATMMIIGFNYGLRISDVVKLRWKDIYNEDWSFRDKVLLREDKTDKVAIIYSNESVQLGLNFFKEYENSRRPLGIDWNEYIFVSESYNQPRIVNTLDNSSKTYFQTPLTESAARDDMKKVVTALNIEGKVTPHSLRKSFGFFGYELANDSLSQNFRSALVLQKKFGHSDIRTTLRYIGIEGEETRFLYMNLNLGLEAIYEFTNIQ